MAETIIEVHASDSLLEKAAPLHKSAKPLKLYAPSFRFPGISQQSSYLKACYLIPMGGGLLQFSFTAPVGPGAKLGGALESSPTPAEPMPQQQ